MWEGGVVRGEGVRVVGEREEGGRDIGGKIGRDEVRIGGRQTALCKSQGFPSQRTQHSALAELHWF